jgi:uncharacterized protein YjbJ (UPF0337 family)
MNTATIKGNWNITKGKLKQKFAQLTDDDLVYSEGQEDELLGRIQRRTGHARDDIERYLRDECDCDFTPEGPSRAKPIEQARIKSPRAFRPSHTMFPSLGVSAQRRASSDPSLKP